MAEFVEVMKNKKRMCEYFKDKYNCDSCNLGIVNNGCGKSCTIISYTNPQQAEEIIMKWAKEHPIKTNREKFKEVFGFCVTKDYCPTECPNGVFEMVSNGCGDCKYKDFWQQEYKEPKGDKE